MTGTAGGTKEQPTAQEDTALTAKAVRQTASKVPRDLPPDGMALAIHMSEGLKALDATALTVAQNTQRMLAKYSMEQVEMHLNCRDGPHHTSVVWNDRQEMDTKTARGRTALPHRASCPHANGWEMSMVGGHRHLEHCGSFLDHERRELPQMDQSGGTGERTPGSLPPLLASARPHSPSPQHCCSPRSPSHPELNNPLMAVAKTFTPLTSVSSKAMTVQACWEKERKNNP